MWTAGWYKRFADESIATMSTEELRQALEDLRGELASLSGDFDDDYSGYDRDWVRDRIISVRRVMREKEGVS